MSVRLDDGQGPSRVLSRLSDGLPKDKKSFPSLKERLENQRDRELKTDTDDPQFITFLEYGMAFVKIVMNGLWQEVLEKLDSSIKDSIALL